MEQQITNNKTPYSTKQYWKNQDKNIKRVNIDIPEDVWIEVAAQAELQGTTKREIVIQALQKFFNEY